MNGAASIFVTVFVAAFGVTATLCGCVSEARAQPSARVVLVELYTSQGCSSCPPADAWVQALPRQGWGRDRVVPLTFHVDYWDDLGWRDPYALPAFTARQDWYARGGRLRSPDGAGRALGGLYTPQMIVDGRVHFPGGQAALAARELQRAAAVPARVELAARTALRGDDAVVTVQARPRPGLPPGDWRLVVALAATHTRTRVLQGENAGETLEAVAVARALSDRRPISFVGSPAPVTVTLRKPPELAWRDVEIVAFVQDEATREVAGAIDERAGPGGTNTP